MAVCFFGLNAFAQAPKPASNTTLDVEVEGGASLRLAAGDLAKIARQDLKAKDHDGKDSTFSEFLLRDILLLADAKFGKDFRGAQLANFVLIEAADSYKAVFAAAELESAFTDRPVLLADSKDGKPLPETHGPWQMIVPDDKKHGRWVRQVTAVKLRSVSPSSVSKAAMLELSDADSVREALFKHTIGKWLPARGDLKNIYLSVDAGLDPSPALLARFAPRASGQKGFRFVPG